jgi:hypothetical protein
MRPKAKRNGVYGYRAQVEFEDGRPAMTIHKTVYPAKYLAENAAKEWILVHKDDPKYQDKPQTEPPADTDSALFLD